MHIDHFSHLS